MKKKSKLLVGFLFAFLATTQFSYSVPSMVKADAENQSTFQELFIKENNYEKEKRR